MINDNVYFKNIIDIGDLYCDYCFIRFEGEPILFVCKDERKQLYLCVCSDIRIEQKWVISKIEIETLRSLINQEVDIFTSLTQNKSVIIVTQDIYGLELNRLVSIDELSELDLPQKGVLLKCDLSEATRYIENISIQDREVISENMYIKELKTKDFLDNIYEIGDVDLKIKDEEIFISHLPVEYMNNNYRNIFISEIEIEKYHLSSQRLYNCKKSEINCCNICVTAA